MPEDPRPVFDTHCLKAPDPLSLSGVPLSSVLGPLLFLFLYSCTDPHVLITPGILYQSGPIITA